jgi:hypothetical protein
MPEEKPISLAPLDVEKALKGLLQAKPPPDKPKPKKRAKVKRENPQ